jgi:biotin operon repressor
MRKKISDQISRARVAKNFIKSYGKGRFHLFLSDLEKGVSGAAIARDLGVSRERVRQWKNSFGIEESVFYPSETCMKVLEDPDIVETFPKTRPPTKKTQIKNFVKKRGVKVFSAFLTDLIKVVAKVDEEFTGQTMAEKYGMSRERVRQLKKAFGTSKHNYNVYSNVNALRR